MTSGDRIGFARHMQFLAECFNEALTEDRIAAYYAVLHELPLAAVVRAVEYHAKRGRFFPRASELRETALAYRPAAPPRRLEDHRDTPESSSGRVAFRDVAAKLRRRGGDGAAGREG